MSDCTIDTAMAKHMVAAAAIKGASIIGQPGGWSVMLKLGKTEKPLGTQRTGKPRMWRSLDTCMEYLQNELRINLVDMIDARNYSTKDATRKTRADSSERLKRAHEAAAYDKWFRAQVDQAEIEADDPNTKWVSYEDAKKHFTAKRKELERRIKAAA
ncbi:MAG: hypothetical protein HY936_02600 [Nitrosomonadales bacterium]|nr:hypothetical protein [Nitrosomonadales bacterium]